MIAPPTTTAMPRDVANACKLLIALILLQATYGLVKLLVDSPPGEHGINLLIGGVVFALLALPLIFLRIKILQRRNWARWMLFALTLVETLSTFATLRESWNESVGDTVVSVISAMILIAVIGLLFARISNDWFANQTTLPDTPPEPHQPDADPRYVTGLGYPCPCCGWKIAFVSKVGLGLGLHPKCPYCNHPLKPTVSILRAIVTSLVIGLPLRIAGTVIPALAFLNGSLSKILILVLPSTSSPPRRNDRFATGHALPVYAPAEWTCRMSDRLAWRTIPRHPDLTVRRCNRYIWKAHPDRTPSPGGDARP